jgi:MtN3 and saliva related transmembrane protein
VFIDIIGYLAGLFLALCFLPQVVHTLRLKSAKDVSFMMLLMSLISACLYQVYAMHLGLTPVIIMNGLFLILNIFELALKFSYDFRQLKQSKIDKHTDA